MIRLSVVDKSIQIPIGIPVDIRIPDYNVIVKSTVFYGYVKMGTNLNIYGAEIGKNTTIHSFVEIRKGVKIGENCIIESFTALAEGVTVGNNVYIGPGVYVTNDVIPRSCKDDGTQVVEYEIISTHIPDNSIIVGGALIKGGIQIGEGVFIDIGAIVTKSLEKGMYIGYIEDKSGGV